MNKELKIPCIFYLYIHSKIRDKSNEEIISKKKATSYLQEWRIPNCIRVAIIKELELLGLVEKVNRNYLKVNRSEFCLENPSKIYEMVGILK